MRKQTAPATITLGKAPKTKNVFVYLKPIFDRPYSSVIVRKSSPFQFNTDFNSNIISFAALKKVDFTQDSCGTHI
jgi:hypothetical protein